LGQRGDLQPDLVLGVVVEGQVAQAGVFGGADAVLDAGVAAVAQFEVSELPAWGVGEQPGDPQPVDVGEPKLGAGGGVRYAGSAVFLAARPTGRPGR
jgi:hypothetical protein